MNEAAPFSSLHAKESDKVIAQLELLLASPLFRHSKRYPAFLRYVVESTLHGDEEELKERTIGVEVFGRLLQYDTSADPIVRLTAAEVRKRLAQYYQQAEHSAELHIDLQPGSYVPAFSWPSAERIFDEPEMTPSSVAVAAEVSASTPEPLMAKRAYPWRRTIPIVVAALLMVAALFLGHWRSTLTADAARIWVPLLNDPNPFTLVLPDLSKAKLLPQVEETDSTTVIAHIRNNRIVDFNDSVALAQIAGMLGKWNKPYTVLLSSDVSFEDLQTGPSILIGAVDNPWTMRFLEPLPYSVMQRGDSMTFEIVAKKNRGASLGWSIDLTQPFGKVQQDYGIIVREMDTMTGKPILIIAGLGQNGTTAGMRLLEDPALAAKITSAAPKGWSGRNLEVIFQTQIIDDKFGPPVIVAREYW